VNIEKPRKTRERVTREKALYPQLLPHQMLGSLTPTDYAPQAGIEKIPENPSIPQIYQELWREPLGEKVHHLLPTKYPRGKDKKAR
jgi:hypothetical protein